MKIYYKIIIWFFVIAYLCFAPADDFDGVHITIPHFDKIVHFGMFSIMGLFIAAVRDVSVVGFNKVWLPILVIIYGGIIEVIQFVFIETRGGDIIDWVADVIGLLIGIWFFRYMPSRVKAIF